MATYGYSAGYQGGGQQAVPSGYIEAYSQAGRNIGAGMQQIGNAIGESLQRYGQNKQENEFLQTRLESLAPYLNTVAQSGNIMDKNSPESKLLGDIEKFSSMSIPQKKATLLNAEFFLDRADKAKAREMQDLQATAARFNLQTAQEAEDRRRATEQAISQVAQLPTQQEMTVPATPAFITSSLNIPAEQQPYTPFYQVQQIPGAAMQQPPAPQAPQGPTFGGMRFGGVEQYAAGLGRNIMPIPAGTNRAQFTQAPGVQAPAPAGIAPIAKQEAPLFESQPIPRATTETQAVPYQDRFRQAIDVFQRFNVPINPEAIRGVLEATGTPQPTTVEQVGNIGSVVRFGGKEQFVPAKEANLDNILKLRGLTIDFPEFRGTATTEAEAVKFRDQYASVLESRKTISELLDIAKMGSAMQQTPEIRAKANSLASSLRGIERINIIGPGTITPEDFKLLESVIPNPTAIFSLKKSNIQAFETMLEKSTRAIESKAKSIGLETINPSKTTAAGQSRSSLASDPRVASIRARMNSGAITRQQAAQELQSLK